MRLYPSIPAENTIQDNNGTCYFSTGAKEEKIIAFDITAIEKYLIPAAIQIGGFCGTEGGDIMNNTYVIHGNSFTGNTNAIYSIKNFNVPCPAIGKSAHGECAMMTFADCHWLRRSIDAKIFNTNLRQHTRETDLLYRDT